MENQTDAQETIREGQEVIKKALTVIKEVREVSRVDQVIMKEAALASETEMMSPMKRLVLRRIATRMQWRN